jgi:hypothetical protein
MQGMLEEEKPGPLTALGFVPVYTISQSLKPQSALIAPGQAFKRGLWVCQPKLLASQQPTLSWLIQQAWAEKKNSGLG